MNAPSDLVEDGEKAPDLVGTEPKAAVNIKTNVNAMITNDKLWAVEIEDTIMVSAPTRQEAERIAKRQHLDLNLEYTAHEATKLYHVPEDWRNEVPYGLPTNGGTTCRSLLQPPQVERGEREAQTK